MMASDCQRQLSVCPCLLVPRRRGGRAQDRQSRCLNIDSLQSIPGRDEADGTGSQIVARPISVTVLVLCAENSNSATDFS